MKDWFTAKIKYLKQDPEKGYIKKVSETFVLNALSHTEAEARLQGILQEFIPEYELLKLDKANFNNVIIDKSKDYFFKLRIACSYDEGEIEAKDKEVFLVQASSSKDAIEKIENFLHLSVIDWEVASVIKTKIIEAFPYIETEV